MADEVGEHANAGTEGEARSSDQHHVTLNAASLHPVERCLHCMRCHNISALAHRQQQPVHDLDDGVAGNQVLLRDVGRR